MPQNVGKGLDPKRDERETSCTAGDKLCRGRQDMPWEMRHTAGGGCRRQVWRHKTSREAEDASGGGRHIGRRKMHRKVEDASEGGRCVRRRRRRRKQKQSSRWKGVAEGGSPYKTLLAIATVAVS